MGFWDGSGISWTIYKQSAPRARQISTPTPCHSVFTGRMLLLTPNQLCQRTEGSCYTVTICNIHVLKTCWMDGQLNLLHGVLLQQMTFS